MDMGRTVSKALEIAVGGMVCIRAAGGSYWLLWKPVTAPPWKITVQMTTQRMARGKYIHIVADCDGCHSLRDFSRYDGLVVESGRGQGFEFPKEMGLPGRIASPNITTDVETGIGGWTARRSGRSARESAVMERRCSR
jgi:hypothetical protein